MCQSLMLTISVSIIDVDNQYVDYRCVDHLYVDHRSSVLTMRVFHLPHKYLHLDSWKTASSLRPRLLGFWLQELALLRTLQVLTSQAVV